MTNTFPKPLPLSALLLASTVETNVSVDSWEDATDYVGELLVQAGKIEPRYIEAMKQVLKELGPYAVVAPGIVLLHARPEDGVLEPCLGLLTLATPVPFGHSENDPVDLVFALGAIDKEAHVASLQNLALVLGDSGRLKGVRSAKTKDELLKAMFINM
jgi:mannitol/fructose-specific phosphotransferase system IIA component (Ntr-type)